MSRQHKYRAWDKKNKIFIYSDQIYIDFYFEFGVNGLMALEADPNCTGDTKEIRDLEPVEQFTGLLDKAGVEICQGDIVRVVHKRVIAEIVWSKAFAGFCIQFKNKYNTERVQHWRKSIPWLMKNGCEIIGHIHESGRSSDR